MQAFELAAAARLAAAVRRLPLPDGVPAGSFTSRLGVGPTATFRSFDTMDRGRFAPSHWDDCEQTQVDSLIAGRPKG